MRRNRLTCASRRPRGFTIVEILVVVVIIAALATLVVPRFFGRVGAAKQSVAASKLQEIDKAIQMFSSDYGQYLEDPYPESLEDLVVRPSTIPETAWVPPALRRKDLLDPWGRMYRYRKPGQSGDAYDLWTLGKDDRDGGTGENADVVSWDVSEP